jgi:RHS repeat-associated protein
MSKTVEDKVKRAIEEKRIDDLTIKVMDELINAEDLNANIERLKDQLQQKDNGKECNPGNPRITAYKTNYTYTNNITTEHTQVLSIYTNNNNTPYQTEIYSNTTNSERIKTNNTYYLTARNGTIEETYNASGNKVSNYDYTAYGLIPNSGSGVGVSASTGASTSASTNSTFSYNGEQRDENGLIYLRARYYNPNYQQFITKDTYKGTIGNIVSQNQYIYANNNPVKYVDPSGHFIISLTATLVIGGAVLGAIGGGIAGNYIANQKGVTGWGKVGYIAGGAFFGGAAGGLAGYIVAPFVTGATGVAGFAVTKYGVTALTTTNIWALDPLTRGYVIEKLFGGWCNNFPVIDKVGELVNGVHQSITSIKSLNLMDKTYQFGNNVYNKIMGYVHSLSDFEGGPKKDAIDSTTKKILELVVPKFQTLDQARQINEAIKDAGALNVELIIRKL